MSVEIGHRTVLKEKKNGSSEAITQTWNYPGLRDDHRDARYAARPLAAGTQSIVLKSAEQTRKRMGPLTV